MTDMYVTDDIITPSDYYTYTLKIEGVPFYIGQGRGQRIDFHRWHARGNADCQHLTCAAIRVADSTGQIFTAEKDLVGLTQAQSIAREKELIESGRKAGFPLVNRDPSGPVGQSWTEEDREKRTSSIRYAWQDEGLKKEQSERQIKRWSDPEERRKQRERMNDPILVANNSAKNKGHTRKALTYEGFVSPDGTVHSPVHNLALFCEEHKLQKSNMCHVNSGKQAAHKGWTRYRP